MTVTDREKVHELMDHLVADTDTHQSRTPSEPRSGLAETRGKAPTTSHPSHDNSTANGEDQPRPPPRSPTKHAPDGERYYAVARGRDPDSPGVYPTWAAAAPHVLGARGGLHESFTRRDDAEIYVLRHRDHNEGAKQKVARLAAQRRRSAAGAAMAGGGSAASHVNPMTSHERTPSGSAARGGGEVHGDRGGTAAPKSGGGTATEGKPSAAPAANADDAAASPMLTQVLIHY